MELIGICFCPPARTERCAGESRAAKGQNQAPVGRVAKRPDNTPAFLLHWRHFGSALPPISGHLVLLWLQAESQLVRGFGHLGAKRCDSVHGLRRKAGFAAPGTLRFFPFGQRVRCLLQAVRIHLEVAFG